MQLPHKVCRFNRDWEQLLCVKTWAFCLHCTAKRFRNLHFFAWKKYQRIFLNPTSFLFLCHPHFFSWEPQKTGKQWWLKTRWEFLLSNFLIFYKYKQWQYNTNPNIRNSGSTCSIVEIGSKNEIKREGLITTSHLPQIVKEGKVIT